MYTDWPPSSAGGAGGWRRTSRSRLPQPPNLEDSNRHSEIPLQRTLPKMFTSLIKSSQNGVTNIFSHNPRSTGAAFCCCNAKKPPQYQIPLHHRLSSQKKKPCPCFCFFPTRTYLVLLICQRKAEKV